MVIILSNAQFYFRMHAAKELAKNLSHSQLSLITAPWGRGSHPILTTHYVNGWIERGGISS